MSRTGEADALFAPGILAGRSAFITGGGSGIGYGIAECLAAAGASICVFSRNEERVSHAVERLAETYGVRTLPTVGDVREPEALRRAVEETRERFGSIDILVNNAAGNFYAPTADLSPNGWRAVVEIDLYGTFHACQAVYPVMAEQGFGRIVSISMDAPLPGLAADGPCDGGQGGGRRADPHAGDRVGPGRDQRERGRPRTDPHRRRAKGVPGATQR